MITFLKYINLFHKRRYAFEGNFIADQLMYQIPLYILHVAQYSDYHVIYHYSVSVVAFYARIVGFVASPGEHTTIPFDLVDLNIGGAYDPTTGFFTAPVDGLYSFSYEAMAHFTCSSYACVGLRINGVGVSDSCTDYANSAGTAVTARLTAGQVALILLYFDAPCASLNTGTSQNKFSGHLLYEIV